jgi:SsrA-binding protein
MAAKKDKPPPRAAALNRRARFDYELGQTFEAGIALTGTEVKSLRGGKSNISDAFAGEKDGELWLYNAYIPEYLQANRDRLRPGLRRRPHSCRRRQEIRRQNLRLGHQPPTRQGIARKRRSRQSEGLGDHPTRRHF